MGIYSYNVFPPAAANYPNITDDGITVNISPTNTNIISDAVQIVAEQIDFFSNNNGNLSIFDFENINFTQVNVMYFQGDNAYIVADGGKLGFFSDINSSVQANAIANATLLNVDVQLNLVLAALRGYGLIKT
jgi:hypothetical protein